MVSIRNIATQANLVKIDQYADYVPFVSTATNLVDIFQKWAVMPFLAPETIRQSHYYTHLRNKTYTRCITLCIPFGGVIVAIFDLSRFMSSTEKQNIELKKQLQTQALQGIETRPKSIKDLSAELKADPEFMVKALKILIVKNKNIEDFKDVFETVLKNPEFYVQYFEQITLLELKVKPESLDAFKKHVKGFVQANASNWTAFEAGVTALSDYVKSSPMGVFFMAAAPDKKKKPEECVKLFEEIVFPILEAKMNVGQLTGIEKQHLKRFKEDVKLRIQAQVGEINPAAMLEEIRDKLLFKKSYFGVKPAYLLAFDDIKKAVTEKAA